MPKYECDNCDFKTTDGRKILPLSECEGLGERLDPGSVVPAGDCPKCRAFVYLTEHDGDDSKARLMNWLATIPDGTKIYIDDDGICIRALGTDAYYELGGHTPDSEADA